MSKIDALIKELQLKKKKIDYVLYIIELITKDTHCIDFKDVQKDVLSQIEPLLFQVAENLENDLPSEIFEHKKPDFEPDQVKILKLLADKALAKAQEPAKPAAPQPSNPQPSQPQPPPQRKPEVSVQEKIRFGLDNRHLANKRVQVINDQNVQIFGTVVGLDAPDVNVKTDTGPTISVPLDKVVLA